MPTINGVIFDLDGVLCSTDQYHYEAWKEAIEPYSVPFDIKTNDKLRGVSRSESLEIILKEAGVCLSKKEKDDILKNKNSIYVEKLERLSIDNLLPHVLETLLELKGYGISLAVGSSSKNARTILCKLGICHIFDAIVDGTEISRSKPDPEVFLKAAQKLALAPSNCAVIEDAEAGIKAAKNGKFLAIGVGDSTREIADFHLDDLKDLAPALLKAS